MSTLEEPADPQEKMMMIINEILKIQEKYLSEEERVLIRRSYLWFNTISLNKLTRNDSIYCIEDIKNLYEQSGLFNLIKLEAMILEDGKDLIFKNLLLKNGFNIKCF